MFDPNAPIDLDMTPTEFQIATQVMIAVMNHCNLAQSITYDQLALAERLQAKLGEREFVGNGKDIIEVNVRVLAAWKAWRDSVQNLMPSLRWLAGQPPMTIASTIGGPPPKKEGHEIEPS